MGALIHLAPATPAGPDAARISVSVGRSLTAADLARQDRYIDARLLGLAPASWGAISGLGVSPARYDSPDFSTGLPSLSIAPGTGIGSDGRLVRVSAPITVAWADLAAAVNPAGPIADGAYLLLVRSVAFDGLTGAPPDPAGRAASDPLLDIQQVSFVEVWLSASIGPLPAGPAPADLALALNILVGGLTPDAIGAVVGNGVPLALLLLRGGQPVLLSQAAGRLAAHPAGPAAMLLAQVREAFAMALADPAANPGAADWQAGLRARFRLLPGAGELPLGLLQSPTLPGAACPFFPQGMTVYLQTIRASQAANLLAQALGRPPLDLTDPSGPAVTLSLAVPDADWTPRLLDLPRADPVLAADLHFAYARARAAQVALRQAWIALYGGMAAVPATDPLALGFLFGADAAAQNLAYLLNNTQLGGSAIATADLIAAADAADAPAALLAWVGARVTALAALAATPPPAPATAPPAALPATTATAAAQLLVTLGYKVMDAEPAPADPAVAGTVPVASDVLLAPLLPALPACSGFADWAAAVTGAPAAGTQATGTTASTTPDPVLLQPLIDGGIVDAGADAATQAAAIAALLALPAAGDAADDDTQPGTLLQLATLQLFYAVLGRVARALETTLGAHSRLIALQRQHLDMMSTSVSALAGGTPPDGSGLSFTRMIPFFELQPTPAASTPDSTPRVALRMQVARPMMAAETARPAPPAPPSLVHAAPVAGRVPAPPAPSAVASRLGSDADVARNVAIDAGTLTQAPPFTFQPVSYGTAAHITPGATLRQTADAGLQNLRGLMAAAPINIAVKSTTAPTPAPTPAAAGAIDDESAAYAGILNSTRSLLGDMSLVEARSIDLERVYLQISDRVQALQARIAQLTASLATARDGLRSAQSAAAKAAGDYAAAQRLVQEEAARLATAAAAREAAIGAATGLFYVRELQTVVARRLPPALTLTADTPQDLAPGCAIDHPGPPAAIQPFLDQLLEVPLADWWLLRERWSDLPDNAGLRRLGALRGARVANLAPPAAFGAGAAAAELAALAAASRRVFDPLFRATIGILPSLAATQQAAFAIFALPDIIPLPPSLLRSNAQTLRARLESAAGCLFEVLTTLPPSTRFAWAGAAQAGTLPPLDFAHWPLPAGLDDAGTAALRRLAGLVNWMAAQLHAGSSAAAQTALGNLVSASVIAAAYGDPDDAVTGSIVGTGGVPRPGVPIRVLLNRPPPIGTPMHLLDASHQVVGTLLVQDHDAQGTTAMVVTSTARTAPTTGWSVAVPGRRAPFLPA